MTPSRGRTAVLVIAPVVVFGLLAFASLIGIGMMAFLSAMGHGQLTDEEALPMYIIGGVISLAGAAGMALFLERRAFGPSSDRTAEESGLAWRTRAASAALIVLLVVGGPPLFREITYRSTVSKASAGADPDGRWEAIRDLGLMRSARAFDVLRSIAEDRSDTAHFRATAITMMRGYPEAKLVVEALAADPNPDVRAVAGAQLVWLANDDASWAVVEGLAHDESLVVRQQMADALSQGPAHPSREAQRTRLLKELSTSAGPGEALSAAKGLGSSGYDAALAILMDVNQLTGTRLEAIRTMGELKNEKAIDVLRAILFGQSPPGLVPPERETAFREAAARSIGSLTAHDPHGLPSAFHHENRTLEEVKKVVEAQKAYRDVTGFFDGRLACLELPATCVRGLDPDQSLLGPAVVALIPRGGYARQFHPGPAVPKQEIAAKRASASSVTTWAYIAVPEVPFETGLRAFCTDDTGQICFTRDGKAPPLRDGRCPESDPWPAGVQPVYPDSATAPRECKTR